MGEPTSANMAPYLMTVSTHPSVDLLISGEYDFNDSSSLTRDSRRDSRRDST
jgi:hypothetical protein